MGTFKTAQAKTLYGTAAVLVLVVFAVFSHRPAYEYAVTRIPLQWQQRAREVSPDELLARPLTKDRHSIPKIFHQSWKTRELEERFKPWRESCMRQHADWRFVVWSNEDNLRLVESKFPWLLDTFKALKDDIYRADMARNLYMYLFGGIYADLDMECLRPAEVIFDEYNVTTTRYSQVPREPSEDGAKKQRTAFFGRMGRDNGFGHSIPNAWMASTPGHPFFLLPLEFVKDKFENDENWHGFIAEDLTGPIELRREIENYEKNEQGDFIEERLEKSEMVGLYGPRRGEAHGVEVLPHQMIYPYAWTDEDAAVRPTCWAKAGNGDFDREGCKRKVHVRLQGSVAITYWTHSW